MSEKELTPEKCRSFSEAREWVMERAWSYLKNGVYDEFEEAMEAAWEDLRDECSKLGVSRGQVAERVSSSSSKPKPKQNPEGKLSTEEQLRIAEKKPPSELGMDKMVTLSGDIVDYTPSYERPKELRWGPPYASAYFLENKQKWINIEKTREEELADAKKSVMDCLEKYFGDELANRIFESIKWDYDLTDEKNIQNFKQMLRENLGLVEAYSQKKWTVKYDVEKPVLDKFFADFPFESLRKYFHVAKGESSELEEKAERLREIREKWGGN